MPNRIIREGWIESERINQLDAAAERFFLHLCLRADDFGRYHGNATLLKSNLFPLREDVRSTDIPRWLAACEKAGLVRCFDVEGKRYIEIPRFAQRTRALVSKFPDPPANVGQVTDKCLTEDSPPRTYSETDTDSGTKTEPETSSETSSETDRQASPDASAALITSAHIYEAYPRKVARGDAIKAIEKAMKTTGDRFAILKATEAYAAATSEWPEEDRKFIPHPATWFNRGSYQDDPATWRRVSSDQRRMSFA